MTYDLETILFELKDFVADKINTEITAINNEKNDGITLKAISTNGYAVQSLDDAAKNQEQFIWIQAIDIRTQGTGPGTIKDYVFAVLAVLNDNQNQLNSVRRILRYGRCLESIFQKNWDRIGSHRMKFKIESIPPQDYTDINGTQEFKVIGVVLTGDLA